MRIMPAICQSFFMQTVTEKMPKRVKKKRALKADDGSDAGWEEYYDYIFPDEAKAAGTLKLLQNVQAWKKRKMAAAAGGADDGVGAAAAAADAAGGDA